VHSSQDAVSTFVRAPGIDLLVLDDLVVTRSETDLERTVELSSAAH